MIYFLTTRRNKHPIRRYLEGHGAALADRITPVLYEELPNWSDPPSGAYIFADIELLNDDQRCAATKTWNILASRGCPRLNHPSRSLRRFDLLRMLHERGLNKFNVFRLSDGTPPARFPVFLRCENDHHGSRSRLLLTPKQLSAAMRWVRWTGGWLGPRLNEMIATEFCYTADNGGVFRKYSAFLVAGHILPRHLFFSDDWMVKSWKLADDRYRQEEAEYLATNPHERELREIFAAAQIEYGRIDYGLLDGQIQVWEINTNPMIVASGRGGNGARSAVHERFATQMQSVLRQFDAMVSSESAVRHVA